MSIHPANSSSDLQLQDNEVIAWCVALDIPASQVTKLWGNLSPDEIARADRFVFEKDRDRYIVGRGVLRTILGRILDQPPAQLRFSYNSYGKPNLTGEANSVEFNVSHSHDLALIGVTRRRSIGVDLEYTRRHVDYIQLAQGFFSLPEQTALLALSTHLQRKAFFNCWTRKEAYIKARGQGLSIPLDQFAVSLQPGQPPELLATAGDDIKQWSLFDLAVHPDYSAALTVQSRDLSLKSFIWVLD